MKPKPNFLNNLLLGVALFVTIMYFMGQTTPPQQTPPAPALAPVQSAQPAAAQAGQPAAPGQPAQPGQPAALSGQPAVAYDDIVIDCPAFTAVFSTQGASMKSYTLKKYYNIPEATDAFTRFPLPLEAPMQAGRNSLALQEVNVGAMKLELAGRHWQLLSLPEGAKPLGEIKPAGQVLAFQTVAGDLVIRRTYDFSPAQAKPGFGFDHGLSFRNNAAGAVTLSYKLAGPAGIVPDDTDNSFGLLNGISGHLTGEKDISRTESYLSDVAETGSFTHTEKRTVWLGLHNRFFTSILLTKQPDLSREAIFERLLPSKDFAQQFGKNAPWITAVMAKHEYQAQASLLTDPITVQPGVAAEHAFQFYAGPLSDRITGSFSPQLENIVTYTYQWLGPISRPLLGILQYIADLTRNYGIAIILLTLIVKVILHPLTRKSMRSQHKMQQIQPLLKQIREKYKDDKQKQQQETMRAFQQNGVNPIGGCLPMLLQMPIFFALYGVFSRAFDIRQEAFIPGWINDLSKPDALFGLGFSVPFFGWDTFNLLPIVYILLQMWNMKMMPKSTDPQMEAQMKMMRLMPVLFGFIFYAMPAGLVLYFTVQSILTICEHYFLKRSLNAEAAQAVPAGDGAVAVTAKVVDSGNNGSGNNGGKKKKKK